MSVDLHFQGIVEPDEDFKKKYAAFCACKEAGIEIPQELEEYFGDYGPNPSGIVVELESKKVRLGEYEYAQEINLKALRPDITKIQIYMS